VFISGAVADFTSPLGVHVVPGREQHGVNQSPSVHHPLNPSRNPLFFAHKKMSDKNIFLSDIFLSAQYGGRTTGREQHGVNQSPSVHHPLNPSRNPLFFAHKKMSDKNIFLSDIFLSAQYGGQAW
jgi:hypothetical protein